MAVEQATTRPSTTLDEAAIEALTARVRGEVIRPGGEGYEAARTVWNASIDRRPALIVCCAGVADVINAVGFARGHDLLVSVRGGGHSVAGLAVCDDGLMIDLSRMKGIRVNPVARTARAEAGLTWGEFDHETQAFGLATTGGIVPSTGIAGLTLGGGLGYLMRRVGLACDNLLSVDVVTADGRLLRASATENEDLFWAVRGGGGNFGVVTSLEYRLHPVGPMVLGGLIFHPLSEAREAIRFYRDFTSTAPDELTTHVALATSPDGHPVAAFIVCYSGPLEDGEAVIRPLREYGQPVADLVGPMPYTAVQALGEPLYPAGRLNYWKSSFFAELSDDAIETLIEQFATVSSPFSTVAVEQLGGAMGRVGAGETAFGDRTAPYSLIVTGAWIDPAASEENVEWVRAYWEAMRPFERDTVYVNYLQGAVDEGEQRIRASYGANYARLAAVKSKYDPTNFFRVNQNIAPAS